MHTNDNLETTKPGLFWFPHKAQNCFLLQLRSVKVLQTPYTVLTPLFWESLFSKLTEHSLTCNSENRKHAYSKDVVVAQLALILECCWGGCGTYREETGAMFN